MYVQLATKIHNIQNFPAPRKIGKLLNSVLGQASKSSIYVFYNVYYIPRPVKAILTLKNPTVTLHKIL